jgi:hypothetical protein
MFDTVRIVSTPETVAAGYADRLGTCFGFTTPSVTGVNVIGSLGVDRALAVDFGEGPAVWFDPSLVAFVDVEAGTVMGIGNKQFVLQPNGDWAEIDGSK